MGVVFIGAEILAWVLWEMASASPWSEMILLAKLTWVGFFSGLCFFPLLAMRALFGSPVAWAQRQERRGLVFADRGARVVGSICAGISLTLLAILGSLGRIPLLSDGPVPELPEVLSEWFLLALTLSGLASSAGVVGLTALRSRWQLVAAVEAGAVTPYRVELRPAGRVLVRVRPAGHGHYRQADEPEELVLLEEAASETKRPERR